MAELLTGPRPGSVSRGSSCTNCGTRATILLRERVPVHVVAKRLGHKDPSITLNVYADAIPDDDGQAVDVFARVVHGT